MAPYDDIPTITESEYNAQMGGGDDIPTITESEYNSMNSGSMLGGNSASISNDEEPSYFDRARQLITDNLFGAPDTEVSWDDLDRARNPQPQAPSVADMFSSGIDQLRAYPATVASGLASASNIPGVRDVGSDLLKMSKPTRRQDLEVFEQIPEDSVSSYVAPTVLGLGKMAPLMLSGLGTVGLAAGTGLAAIGEKEAQMEDMGLSRQAAAPAAMTSGIANALLSSPLFATARSGLNPLVKTGLGALEGYGQGFGGTLADIYGTFLSTGEAPEFDEAMARSNKGGVISATMGGILAPLGGSGKKGKVSQEFDLPTENVPPGTRAPVVDTPPVQADSFIPSDAPALPEPAADTGSLSIPDMMPEAPPVQKTVVPSKPVDLVKEMGSKEFPDIQKLAKQSAATVEEAPAPQLTQVEVSPVVKDVPTYEVPLSEIFLSQDVPNFKRGANEKGVVEPLSGKYERLGTPPIVVWERLNGRKEVITGRHKLDLAQRTGESTIPTQIVREADGFTSDMAKIFDAESNIRDEKGSVLDYATYFKNTGLGEGEAAARGLLSRSKGVQGFDIGTKATTEVYSLHANGEISDAKAAAIARAAPNDAGLQRAGLAFAKKGLNAQQIYNAILATAELEKKLPDGTAKWKEWQDVNLFEDTDRAMKLGEDAGIIAEQFQKDIGLEIQATQGAAKNPEKARSKGVSINNPEAILEGNKKLALERQRWANWAKYPDLFKKVMDKVKGESGQTRIISDIANSVGDVAEKMKTFVRGSDADPDINLVSKTQARYEGGRLRHFNKGMGQALGEYRKQVEYLSTAAQTDPRAGEALDVSRGYFRRKSSILFDSRETLDPYFSAPKELRAELDKDLIRFRMASLEAAKQGVRLAPMTPEFLASKGWSPQKIEMFQAVRKGMDDALDIKREAFYKDAENLSPDAQQEFISEVDNYIEAQKDMNYIPLTRFGDTFHVVSKNENGKVISRTHHNSAREAKAALREAKGKGLKAQLFENPTPDYDAKSGMPPDMLPDAQHFNAEKWQQMKKEGKPLKGFAQHLVRAGGIEGYNPNLAENISDYLFSLSSFAANKELQPKVKSILKSIDPVKEPKFSGRIAKHFEELTKPNAARVGGKAVGTAIRFSNFIHLAGTPITAMADVAQAQALAIPAAVKKLGSAWNPLNHIDAVYLHEKSFAKTLDYMGNPFKKRGVTSLDKATLGYLKQAERDGLLGTQTLDDLYDYAKGPGTHAPLDQKLMFFKSVGEKAQRTSSFITGLEVAKRLKLSGDDAYKFAQDFFYEVVPDTTKADQPLIMNNAMAKGATLYKKYLGFDLRTLRNWANPKDFPLIMTSMVVRASLGGIVGIPFAKEADKIAKSYGIDVNKMVREWSPEWADNILYGLTSKILNFSPSMSTQELVPEIDKNPYKAIGQTFAGPIPGYFMDKLPKAYNFAKDRKYWNAFEAGAPRFMRNASKATRLLTTGNLADASGLDPGVPPTLANAGRLLLGAPPIEQTRAYELKNAEYDIAEKARETTRRYNQRYTDAINRRDFKEANKLALEFRKKGGSIQYNYAAKDPEAERLKRAPKIARKDILELRGIHDK